MKFLVAIFVAVLIATHFVQATTPHPGVFGTGQWRDRLYAVSPLSPDVAAVKWSPEKEECPLSVSRALSIARDSLRRMVGADADLFQCDELKLVQSNASWFYVVRFFSRHPRVATKGEVGVFPAFLPFIVYLNGKTELPFEKKA